MKLKTFATAAATGAALLLGAAYAAAHGPVGHQGSGGGTMGPGMMGTHAAGTHAVGAGAGGYGMMGYGMGPGMMGRGMMGYGMMGRGMMGYGMMGRGYGMMGPGMMPALREDLSVADVKHMMGHQLAWMGNPHLKLGKVEQKDADTIVAEIVTQDGSLVQRLEINRHTGWTQPVK
jgi:hypothetical protein